jgi:hypothetical protein
MFDTNKNKLYKMKKGSKPKSTQKIRLYNK